MRHYDLADRTRNRFTGQVDIVPTDAVDVQRVGRRRQGRLRRQLLRPAGVDRSARSRSPPTSSLPNGLGAGAQLQLRALRRAAAIARRRAPAPGRRSAARLDGRLDRDACTTSRSTRRRRASGATPKRGLSYDYSHAEGELPLRRSSRRRRCRRPVQLPDVFNKLQQLHLDVRHRLSNRLAATFSYLYEPFRVYDFAFDPTRGQQHRPAELAGPGLRLSSVHRALRRVRPAVFLVVARTRRLESSGGSR